MCVFEYFSIKKPQFFFIIQCNLIPIMTLYLFLCHLALIFFQAKICIEPTTKDLSSDPIEML